MADFRSRALIVFKGKDLLSKTFNKLTQRIGSFQNRAHKLSKKLYAASLRMRTFSVIAQAASAKLAVAGGAIGYGLKTAVSSAFEYNKVFNSVTAKSKVAGVTIDQLRKKSLELGLTTRFSSLQTAKGMDYLSQAGNNTRQVYDSITPSLEIAQATNTGLAESADYLTNIMQASGLETEKTTWAADRLALVTVRANTNFTQLAEAMTKIAPTASALGMEFEELIATTGLLGNIGIKSTEAGAMFRRIAAALVNPRVIEKLEKLGVTVKETLGPRKGKLRAFTDIIEDMGKSFSKLDEVTQGGIATELFGIRSMSGLLKFIGPDFIKRSRQLQEELKGADGTLKKMAETMNKGMVGPIYELISAYQGFKIDLGETAWAVFGDQVKIVTQRLRGFTKLSDRTKKLIVGIGAAIVAVSGALILFTTGFAIVAGVLTLAASAQVSFLVALQATLGTVGLIAGAFAAVIAVVYVLWKYWDKIRNFVTSFESVRTAIDGIKMAFKALWGFLKDKVYPILKKIWDIYAGVMKYVGQYVSAVGRFASRQVYKEEVRRDREKELARIAPLISRGDREYRMNSNVKVTFENAPPGTTYRSDTDSNIPKDSSVEGNFNVGISNTEEI